MPVLCLIAAATLWAMIGPVSKLAFMEGITPLETAYWRGLIAGAMFFMHSLFFGRVKIGARDVPPLFAFGIFGVALMEGSNLLTVAGAGAAYASVLLYTAPAWVALFSRILFKEKLTPAKLIALAVITTGICGVALSGGSQVDFAPTALFWGVLSGISYAMFYIFGKLYFSRYQAPTVYLYAFPIASLVLLPFVEFQPKSAYVWGVLVFMGIVSTYLAYLVYSIGLKRMDATRASLIACLEPVLSTFLAYLIWGEKFGGWGYLGAAGVILGVAMMSSAKH